MDNPDLREVVRQLFDEEPRTKITLSQISGGCIHRAGVFDYRSQKYFIKWNTSTHAMFEAEAKGLNLLRNVGKIYVPQVVGYGTAIGIDYLCMEYIQSGEKTSSFWEAFGVSLAQLHRHSSPSHGLDHDNFIGRLEQSNTPWDCWVDFFIHERLLVQLCLAQHHGFVDTDTRKKFDVLIPKLADLMPEEQPALMHGDLWSGNMLAGYGERPVIFDPAIYFGHREAELAFTRLFGGFDQRFYRAYEQAFPLQPGYQEREDIFNLYPLLVHLNLFGTTYLQGIKRTLRRWV